jgi:hypothetical protein
MPGNTYHVSIHLQWAGACQLKPEADGLLSAVGCTKWKSRNGEKKDQRFVIAPPETVPLRVKTKTGSAAFKSFSLTWSQTTKVM